MINNNLTFNLATGVVQQIIAHLQAISNLLPFLMSLTPEERQSLSTVSDARWPYVEKCAEYCKNHRGKIGMAQEDLDELLLTLQNFENLRLLYGLARDLLVGLRDTKMQVGANLYRQSRAGHATIEIARMKGRPGVESILEELDKLFEGQGNFKPKDQNTEEVPKTNTEMKVSSNQFKETEDDGTMEHPNDQLA